MQARASEDLKRLVTEKLKAAGLTFTRADAYATPRRLALVVDGLPTAQPDVKEEKKGPRVGSPQQAIDGFLKSAGLTSLDQCEKRDTGKGEFYFAVIEKKGQQAWQVIAALIKSAVMELPWPKSMRWADYDFRWVRPLSSCICLFDSRPISLDIILRSGSISSAVAAGPVGATGDGDGAIAVRAGSDTVGHRFLAPGKITVSDFADYQSKLRAAKVILDPAERRAEIWKQAQALAAKEGLTIRQDDGLLDEVTGLVEWPVALMGRIDDAFMTLPPEVMTTTMRVNQKYFAVLGKDGKLAPRFIVVANTEADDGGQAIVAGNERVLRARLSDAQFFWEQDKKVRLQDRVSALDGITYHAKLGSVGDKVKRMRALAAVLSEKISGGDAGLADQAAHLSKRTSCPAWWGSSRNSRVSWGVITRGTRDFPTPWPTQSPIITSRWGRTTYVQRHRSRSPWRWPRRSIAWSASSPSTSARPVRRIPSPCAARRSASSASFSRTSCASACARFWSSRTKATCWAIRPTRTSGRSSGC